MNVVERCIMGPSPSGLSLFFFVFFGTAVASADGLL